MNAEEFLALAAKFASLRIALIGDFCLDRYLEIDPQRHEISIETGLPVYNVVHVRAQPGGAGTILNNLVALGVGTIHAVGFCGDDGEGYELRRALATLSGVRLDAFLTTSLRRTFTYCKPLLVAENQPPRELNRLDSKNWSPTPTAVEEELARDILAIAPEVDAIIVLDQVDEAETGVVTQRIKETLRTIAEQYLSLPILADSRRGLQDWPPVMMKMNAAELAKLTGQQETRTLEETRRIAQALARLNSQKVFVTLAEQGLIGASAAGASEHVPAFPVRGAIDIVGAGDAVTANLAVAIAAGGTLREALVQASAAASIVIHQLGTTGTAQIQEIAELLAGSQNSGDSSAS